ncbi:unnamed protein product [Rangifer tarandus platyrhynchus]|uniref:Uncharacterized protein n=1 Tax=Rangifer tarandus platyrhynchus TaxID=3082113 RepID=A0AC59ZU52_RANTA
MNKTRRGKPLGGGGDNELHPPHPPPRPITAKELRSQVSLSRPSLYLLSGVTSERRPEAGAGAPTAPEPQGMRRDCAFSIRPGARRPRPPAVQPRGAQHRPAARCGVPGHPPGGARTHLRRHRSVWVVAGGCAPPPPPRLGCRRLALPRTAPRGRSTSSSGLRPPPWSGQSPERQRRGQDPRPARQTLAHTRRECVVCAYVCGSVGSVLRRVAGAARPPTRRPSTALRHARRLWAGPTSPNRQAVEAELAQAVQWRVTGGAQRAPAGPLIEV